MGMMEIYHYIISSPVAYQRRTQIDKNFREYGIKPNFFNAIMGNQLTEQELQQFTAKHNILNKGAIGCALSHLEIYRQLLKSEEPYVFIFEDDVRLSPDFVQYFPKIKEFLNQMTKPAVLLLYRVKAPTKTVFSLGNGYKILHALAGTAAHGYVINRKAAENLLKAQNPIQFEIDAWNLYYKLGYLTIYCINHEFGYLDSNVSRNSVIEQVAEKERKSSRYVNQYKKEHFMTLYFRYPIWKRCILQLKRIQRHFMEMYYDKENK